jgi:hypothetical protein
LIYSIKTAYTPCLEEGQTWEEWYENLNEGQKKTVEFRPVKSSLPT